MMISHHSPFGPHPEHIPSHHPHAFADHLRQFTFSSLGNVNDREWSVNVRKYLYGGDGALGEQASCLLCLLIHRCQTDFKQISVLHLSNICGQTGCLPCLLIHRCQTDFKQISVLHLSIICGQTGSDGALGEQAFCLPCLLIHRCQTDIKQISVLHLSNICGQTGGDRPHPERIPSHHPHAFADHSRPTYSGRPTI